MGERGARKQRPIVPDRCDEPDGEEHGDLREIVEVAADVRAPLLNATPGELSARTLRNSEGRRRRRTKSLDPGEVRARGHARSGTGENVKTHAPANGGVEVRERCQCVRFGRSTSRMSHHAVIPASGNVQNVTRFGRSMTGCTGARAP